MCLGEAQADTCCSQSSSLTEIWVCSRHNLRPTETPPPQKLQVSKSGQLSTAPRTPLIQCYLSTWRLTVCLKAATAAPWSSRGPLLYTVLLNAYPSAGGQSGTLGGCKTKRRGLVSHTATPASSAPQHCARCQHSHGLAPRCSQLCYEKLIASAFQIRTQRDQKDKNKRISILSHPLPSPALILQWIFFRKNSSPGQGPCPLLHIATATQVIRNA